MRSHALRSPVKLKRQRVLPELRKLHAAPHEALAHPEDRCSKEDLGQGCWLLHSKAAWTPSEASAITERLLKEVNWDQKEITILGKRITQPRLVAYEADAPDLYYTYSRTQLQPEPWHAVVAEIKVNNV